MFLTLGPCASGQFVESRGVYSSGGARPILITRPARLEKDAVKFVNGDSLTGTVQSIAEYSLTFSLDLVGETADFPLRNISQLSFAGPPNPVPERTDVIYLQDGSSLSANVTALGPDTLDARTVSGQRLAIAKPDLIGIGLHCADNVLFENDFSTGKDMGLVPVMGSWSVEKGCLVQAAPKPFCRAYARIVQAGMMRYEWSTDASTAHNAGILFFASRYDTRFGQTAYMVMLKNRMVYLYKVVNERRHQAWRERVKSISPLVHLITEYDPRSGEIVVRSGEQVVVRLVDPDPIERGDYVLLHTEGKASYDDVRVTHLVGGIHGLPLEGDLDTLLLSNGDRVSGEVVEISDRIVLKNSYAPSETPIDRVTVRSIVFANSRREGIAEQPSLPQISLWNGDKVLAHIVSLDTDKIVLKPTFVEKLLIARGDLREIVFPEGHGAASPEEIPPDRAADLSHEGQVDLAPNALENHEHPDAVPEEG